MEYKAEISNSTSLVEEVAAFANTRGVDIIIGIAEGDSAGIPSEIKGIDIEDPDKWMRGHSQSISSNTDPQITQFKMRCIPLSNGRYAIIIRVSRSMTGPHMVKNFKFPIRIGTSKIPASTSEIRRLMSITGSLNDHYSRFRVQRITKTVDVYKMRAPFVMVHYVPVSAFEYPITYPVIDQIERVNLYILGSTGANPRINSDGLINLERGERRVRAATHRFLEMELLNKCPTYHSIMQTIKMIRR
ncbi:AlbA family DNA-binding domain-containing protein [Paenibacillus massiliensis]|uniref:AlbA family DNA-binding domain-containing protein n=1 Tax=Paenibacillus massiliensis TaxID=225917 RepID=UPI00041412FD|nr:ATP-binding protein [Paenibacillus massiliensis]